MSSVINPSWGHGMALGVTLICKEVIVAALQGIKWTAEVKRGIKAIYVMKHQQAETATLEEKEMGATENWVPHIKLSTWSRPV